MSKYAIIIGVCPAKLTVANELVRRTDIKPIVLEMSENIGGISRTEVYKGNIIGIGGHRFFSKSDVVIKWLQNILPIQGTPSRDELNIRSEARKKAITSKLSVGGPDTEEVDNVMLIRSRLSRMFFLRKLFDYPISINWQTLSSLGFLKIMKIGWTYLLIRVFPKKNITTLEQLFISRFGKELYETFFKDYTKKVCGVPCSEIYSNWGTQRINELSSSRTILNVLKSIFIKNKSIEQEDIDTSLIERFMYPKLVPGQMWETVAKIIEDSGGETMMKAEVANLDIDNNCVSQTYIDKKNKLNKTQEGDYFFSTKSIKHLIRRNGMHKCNNQDHSILTAITAVNNIIEGIKTKDNIWEVNVEKIYHEKK